MERYTYIIRDLEGNKLSEGTAEDLADEYFTNPNTIEADGLHGRRLMGRYMVECKNPHRPSEKAYHYCIYNSDDNQAIRGTASQIARMLECDPQLVGIAARKGRKLKGYTVEREE